MDANDRRFIFHDLQKIKGYLDPPDALVFHSLLKAQNAEGLNGGMAEIGIYYGRSYFLLRRVGGDNVVAIDLFDLEPNAAGVSKQRELFVENGRRLGLPVKDDLVIQGDSTVLDPQEITRRVGPVRFFSIDGGHHLHHVVADTALAVQSLAPHGVIVFDDTFNPAWPEVTVGVGDFLRQHADDFACFCMTKYKTYVCRRAFFPFYERTIAQAPGLTAFEHSETAFLGSSVTRLHNPLGRRMIYEVLVRTGMTALSERAYR